MDAETELPPAPLATYTLQLFGPGEALALPGSDEYEIARRVKFNMPGMAHMAAEDLNDLLPEGFSVRIKEWDDEHD